MRLSQILYAYEDEMGEDVIASLDFWSRPQSPGANQRPDQRPAVPTKEYGTNKEYGMNREYGTNPMQQNHYGRDYGR
jgi:hypothetical protein